MRQLANLFFCMIVTCTYGQDWQTIKSNQTHYFANNDTSYVLATRTDSTDFISGDSVFYSFRTLRAGDPSISGCEYQIKPCWFGEKVIVEPDGSNIYFNGESDSIFIETFANLNDTFLVYTYPTGEYIKAWVSDVSEMEVLGITDSVKTLSLFTNSSSFDLGVEKFLLSKNFGFAGLFPFYSFPEEYVIPDEVHWSPIDGELQLVGSENMGVGVTRMTRAEIYDYNIGDEYKLYTGQSELEDYYLSRLHELKVIDEIDCGPDCVQFVFEERYEVSGYDYAYSMPINEYQDWFEWSEEYTSLDSFQLKLLPEELDTAIFPNTRWTYISKGECNRQEDGAYYAGGYNYSSEDSTCVAWYGFDSSTKNEYYLRGTGNLFARETIYTGYSHENHWGSYLYINDSEGSCGDNFVLSAGEASSEKPFRLYPNPVQNELNIDSFIKIQDVVIYDASGRKILSFHNQTKLDLNSLEAGIYLIQISDGVHSYEERFIKN